jgi:hypothetical protein
VDVEEGAEVEGEKGKVGGGEGEGGMGEERDGKGPLRKWRSSCATTASVSAVSMTTADESGRCVSCDDVSRLPVSSRWMEGIIPWRLAKASNVGMWE